MTGPHPRAVTRTTTLDYEGWMEHHAGNTEAASERLIEHVDRLPPPNALPSSVLRGKSRWQTDITTFCSHIQHDTLLQRSYVTEIQNRKSGRLPYLQEYLLLFFSAGQRQFVARIDHPSQAGAKNVLSGSSPGLGWGVTIYCITDSEETPWFADDKRRGSKLVATLTTWADLERSFVSHHLTTVRDGSSGRPSLQDVCRLVQAVVLEVPSCYFKTVSSFMASRASVLVIQNRFAREFACQLGEERELVPASALDESAWFFLLRWYLPFAAIALVLYVIAVVMLHIWVAYTLDLSVDTSSRAAAEVCIYNPSSPLCAHPNVSVATWHTALKLVLHIVLDLPFPVGLLHTWLSAKEMQMAGIVAKVSASCLGEELEIGQDSGVVRTPFGAFSRPWFGFAVANCVGCVVGLVLYFGILYGHGIVALLFLMVCVGVAVNYTFPPLDSGDAQIESPVEDELALLDCEAAVQEPPMPGPSSSRL